MGVARLRVVGPGAAEVLHRDVLAGDGLDDVGTGDEHRGGLVDHDREVGDGGGVDVPAGAVAHDQADLRDDARGVHVAAEDLAVEAEGDHALLDARAGALVDADDRAAGLDREVHHLGDLLAVDLAQRAAEDGEVLAEDAHHAAVDLAVAGDDAVAVRAVLLQPERGRAVPRELVELDEGALVEEHLDALARGLAALRVLLLDRLRRARRAPPRRAAAPGPPACRRWCGCRCRSLRRGRRCPHPAVHSRGGLLVALALVGCAGICLWGNLDP